MALSNIRKEPRREVTESAVGLLLVSWWCVGTAWLAKTMACLVWQSTAVFELRSMGLLIAFMLSAWCLLGLLLHHAMGEVACDLLDDVGIRLRPKRRYL